MSADRDMTAQHDHDASDRGNDGVTVIDMTGYPSSESNRDGDSVSDIVAEFKYHPQAAAQQKQGTDKVSPKVFAQNRQLNFAKDIAMALRVLHLPDEVLLSVLCFALQPVRVWLSEQEM